MYRHEQDTPSPEIIFGQPPRLIPYGIEQGLGQGAVALVTLGLGDTPELNPRQLPTHEHFPVTPLGSLAVFAKAQENLPQTTLTTPDEAIGALTQRGLAEYPDQQDRKSTRLNSSHSCASRIPS